MNQRKRISDLVGYALVSAMLGGALALSICDALMLSTSFFQALLYCGLTATVCMLMHVSKRTAIITSIALVIAVVFIILFKLPPYHSVTSMFKVLMQVSLAEDLVISAFAPLILATLCVIFTCISYFMASMKGGIFPALTLTMMIFLGCWLFEKRATPIYVVPALAALGAMFAKSHDDDPPLLPVIPIALIAALLSLALIPAGRVTLAPLKTLADGLRQQIYDYLLFSDSRTPYSVYSDGFLPLVTRLGGPADPSNFSIMEVATTRDLLLRGSLKRTYTGTEWVDTAVSNRYLFVDPTKRGTRNTIFDSLRPDPSSIDELASGLFTDYKFQVELLSRGTSTLFIPHKITKLSTGDAMVPYFNSNGEVFITRPVRPGDEYSVTATLINTYHPQFEAYLNFSEGLNDPLYNDIQENYLQLPSGISPDVYQLASDITAGLPTALKKAQALENHLKTSYPYTLEVDVPPSDRDFVSYFLLETKKGYCTYFASAMTVMARMVGLPSRYVEGYMVTSEADGSTTVTGRNAHAWVEIYFKGIGWVTFNPTPNTSTTPPDVEETPPPPDSITTGTPSPSPTPTPTPTPTPPPPDNDSQTPTPEPSPTPENTADPNIEPTPTPTPIPPNENDSQTPNLPHWLIMLLIGLLILLLAIGAIVMRLLMTRPSAIAAKKHNSTDVLVVWYRAILTVLEAQGVATLASETPMQFAVRLKEQGIIGNSFISLTEALISSVYGNREQSDKAILAANTAYTALIKKLKLREKINWYRRRVMKGIGDIGQIP